MSFKILLLAPDADPSWPEKIRRAVTGVVVNTYSDPQDALDDIADADAAYGTVPPELPRPRQEAALDLCGPCRAQTLIGSSAVSASHREGQQQLQRHDNDDDLERIDDRVSKIEIIGHA